MTYEKIVLTLDARRLTSTITSLDYAVREEACSLIENTSSHGKYQNARHRELRIPNTRAVEAARKFYAADITELFDNPVEPSPDLVFSSRRFPVAWAVAEVLRTNGNVTEGGKKKV